MTPVVLLVGQLKNVVNAAAAKLDYMPVRWLGAHNRDQALEQLEAEPGIAAAIIGGTLDDAVRGEIVAAIASRRPDICIYVKDRASGPDAFSTFVERVVRNMVLQDK